MTPQEFERRLSAILSADVAEYSRLMRDDEEDTVRTLTAYKEMIFSLIERNQGRLVDSTGDNLLAEFASVVDAVRCAVQIQEDLKAKNDGLDENRKMEFRIGINLGDVILEGDRIYGDGVNVAARIESLADAGGICISRSVYDQVKRKLNFRYDYLGEHEVKNIDEPVSVYKVLIESGSEEVLEEDKIRAPASEENMAYPLSEKPSIAVLPFVNMSNDPEQEYFSDGITEDIITDLSKISGINVIARNSSFIFKGKNTKVQQVAKDLGVKFIVEGSVRRAGNRLRITAQLIDGQTEHHLWAERYDRELNDIFSVQDDVTKKIVSELSISLTADEFESLTRKYTDNFEAYDLYLRAVREYYELKKENLLKAQELSKKVIELDPNFAGGYSLLSCTLIKLIRFDFSTSPIEDAEKAYTFAQKAVSVDDTFSMSYFALADAYLIKGKQDDALNAAMINARKHPGDAESQITLGFFLHWAGRGKDAVQAIKKGLQLDPKYTDSRNPMYLDFLGYACFTAGLYEESFNAWKESINRFGPIVPRQAFLIASCSELGRDQEGRAIAQQLIKNNPNFTLKSWKLARMYKNAEDTERLLNALRRAGLK